VEGRVPREALVTYPMSRFMKANFLDALSLSHPVFSLIQLNTVELDNVLIENRVNSEKLMLIIEFVY